MGRRLSLPMLDLDSLRFVALSPWTCGLFHCPYNIPQPQILVSPTMTTPPPSAQTSVVLMSTISTTLPSTQTLLAPQRPLQGRFHSDEQGFLRTFLPAYHKFYQSLAQKGTGERGIKGTKGKKRSWVLDNVYPAFAKQFNSAGPNGPNTASLKDVSTLLPVIASMLRFRRKW